MDMLEHQKTVLENVISNDELFAKELKKSLCWLETSEIRKLYNWLKEKYGSTHNELIDTVFKKDIALDFKFG